MSLTVFGAVLVAAMLHAGWNALVKSSLEKHVAMTAVILGHLPLCMVALVLVPAPHPDSWHLVVISALLHLGYQGFLVLALRLGDLTQVYPIARGLAPLIVTGVGIGWLGVELTPMETIAVCVIALGVASLGFARGADGLRNPRAVVAAVVTGGFIASYSLADGVGARLSGSAVGYYAWIGVVNSVLLVPLVSWWRPGTVRLALIDGWRLALIGGSASFVAYAIVVWAFTQAPIPLVTALRETSVVFALLFGAWLLRERPGGVRIAACLITVVGAVLLRFAR